MNQHEVTLDEINELHRMLTERFPDPNVLLDTVLCWLAVGLWTGPLEELGARLAEVGVPARATWKPRIQTQPGGDS